MNNIRNFCILAHIDHGKSTLADRFLELTGTVEKRKMREQMLDQMELEREKGITIKMAPVRMKHRNIDISKFRDSEYILNLIDTPGHVDFSYEVSRALACVEGAILLVDAAKGVQAQTIANLHLARQQKVAILPAINKIDLSSADVPRTEKEIVELLGVRPEDIFKISAKTGEGVEELLHAVIEKIPPPRPDISKYRNVDISSAPLRALVFDSKYDAYLGVIAYVRVFEGELKKNDRLIFLATRAGGEAKEVGVFSPLPLPTGCLGEGEIGYVATGVKEPEKVRVGDTITRNIDISTYRNIDVLPGYREPTPMVFASVFPERQDDYDALRDGLAKLKLEDGALFFEPEDAAALGRGMRAGFLGMLHMEIVSERLKREYGLRLVFSTPSVAFRVHPVRDAEHTHQRNTETAKQGKDRGDTTAQISNGVNLKHGGSQIVTSASQFNEQNAGFVEEPWAEGEMITPLQFLGTLTQLLNEHRGVLTGTETLAGERLIIRFQAPLREIIVDFYDKLKSVSQGFASMSYFLKEYRKGDFVRLDIAVAGDNVPAFAAILPREDAYREGRVRVLRLKEILPRELFAVSLQAVVAGQVIARETVPALKKDVTGYLYGGDRTRKMKLWKKQQRGKKRLKSSARVQIAPEVFLKMLKPR